jgi:hypothetical protein
MPVADLNIPNTFVLDLLRLTREDETKHSLLDQDADSTWNAPHPARAMRKACDHLGAAIVAGRVDLGEDVQVPAEKLTLSGRIIEKKYGRRISWDAYIIEASEPQIRVNITDGIEPKLRHFIDELIEESLSRIARSDPAECIVFDCVVSLSDLSQHQKLRLASLADPNLQP